ncbi:Glycoside hydrolase, 38 vacuolar alpha mannosidase [Apophysomyces ossiformis]|uniref:Alpha-mannosidase n=1 Tax=Apophysomyces ossiformis TaxID=679940 RepID=A0A8H7BX09_9FUNG|nr:Glycoside hydrolase, 38 vacuolar alpha mannosidase [Apophysomyces ossiformis]
MERFRCQQQDPAVLETPKLVRSITIDRCSNFTSGGANGNDINLLSQLYKARTNSEEFISLLVYSVPDLKRISFAEAIQQEFRPTRLGEWFGPSWSTHWFHVQLRIPNEFAGEEVHFIWNADNEAMIWSVDGVPQQGLTGGAGSDARHEYILTESALGGEIIQFYIEMACNGMFGAGSGLIGPPDPNRFFNLNELDLAVPNKLAWDLLYDFQIILGMAKDLPQDSLRAAQALRTANAIVNTFRPGDDRSIMECLDISARFLSAKNGDSQHQIHAVGHCHIDTAWLWPFEETVRKSARSWSSQLDLMDRYGDYKFICSQAQQYEWVKKNYPPLWEKIRTKIAQNQFMPTGGGKLLTLIVARNNSQRFFESNFGKRCKVFWLPDSFGYSSQLPQLVRLADMKYFFTQKLSWNNVNKFPLTTFWWTGLDGTKVLTHMAPSETYNAQCTPEELIRTVRNHRDKEYSNSSLLVYGNGDGGGGPLASMIERLRRMKNVDGLPKVEMSTPVTFFENLEKECDVLTTWKGELYFELHRGIYTTHALCKKFNRSSEFLLRDIEMLSTFASLIDPIGFNYPKEKFDEFWKTICLIQFHDVMAGSSIEMVYDDSLRMYTQLDVEGKQLREELMETLLGPSASGANERQALAVFNSLSWPRREIIEVPLEESFPTMKQYSAFGRTGYVLLDSVPALAAQGFTLDEMATYEPATFDKSGHLIGLYDRKVQRELIRSGERANVFKMFEDIPLFWDAWDVEIYHLEKGRVVEEGSVQILEQGPLRAALLIEKRISENSRLRQIAILTAISRRIDFETEIDWNENRQFLKVEFAWDILADSVYYETQYGVVQRPTHYNTSWDSAKFEVVAQKFADLSEYGYGVAILNDCKYGYSAHNNVVSLSLLRSPKAPDSNCDIGHFMQSDVVREGYNFNVPLITKVIPSNKVLQVATVLPQLRIEGAPNVVLDTIKKAENSDDVIVRFYEAYGGRATARLVSSLPIKSIYRCNILEDDMEMIIPGGLSTNGFDQAFTMNLTMIDGNIIEIPQPDWQGENESTQLTIAPFEVVTLKISF